MESILIIDDDESVRTFMRGLFESQGYSVRAAVNGAEGLALYRESPADVVFCDLFMPDREGLETIWDLLRVCPGARIVAVSGGWSAIEPGLALSLARHLGADAVVAKPFNVADLLEMARSLCAGRDLAHADAPAAHAG